MSSCIHTVMCDTGNYSSKRVYLLEQHSFFPFENAVAKSLILDAVVAILVIHEC